MVTIYKDILFLDRRYRNRSAGRSVESLFYIGCHIGEFVFLEFFFEVKLKKLAFIRKFANIHIDKVEDREFSQEIAKIEIFSARDFDRQKIVIADGIVKIIYPPGIGCNLKNFFMRVVEK